MQKNTTASNITIGVYIGAFIMFMIFILHHNHIGTKVEKTQIVRYIHSDYIITNCSNRIYCKSNEFSIGDTITFVKK